MAFASWFRFRPSLSRNDSKPSNPDDDNQKQQEELLGVTDKLIDFIKSFNLDTLKKFPLQEEEEEEEEGVSNYGGDDSPATRANIRNDLSEWQERHAVLVLSKVKVFFS